MSTRLGRLGFEPRMDVVSPHSPHPPGWINVAPPTRGFDTLSSKTSTKRVYPVEARSAQTEAQSLIRALRGSGVSIRDIAITVSAHTSMVYAWARGDRPSSRNLEKLRRLAHAHTTSQPQQEVTR